MSADMTTPHPAPLPTLDRVSREFNQYLRSLAEYAGCDMEEFDLPSAHGNDRLRWACLIQEKLATRAEVEALKADLAAARDELARLKAGAETATAAVRCCPQCGGAIQRVTNTGGWMNPDQFDAVKAGDWYCESCPDNGRGASGLCYWFDTELADQPAQQSRLAAMQPATQPQPSGDAAKG